MMPSEKMDSCSSAPPEEIAHHFRIDSRRDDEGAHAVDREHRERKEDPIT
jgi:hypothetical protein